MSSTDPAAAGAYPAAAAAERLYRACGQPPPVILTAADAVGFVRLLTRAGPGPGAGAVWLLVLGSLPPGAVALAAWTLGIRAPEILALLIMLGSLVLLTVYGPAPGSDPPAAQARATRRAAALLVTLLALVALLVTGSPATAAIVFGAIASVAGLGRALLLANGGLPGRLGLAAHAGPPAMLGQPSAALARALTGNELPRGSRFSSTSEPAAPAWARLEELGRRRLDWEQVEPALLLGRLLPASQRGDLAGTHAAPPPALAAARALDGLCEAAALFERVAVLLLPPGGSAPPATTSRPGWRPSREPYASVLRLLQASPAFYALVAFAPGTRTADRVLARLVASEPDPALRLEAIERIGPERFFAALGTSPVDRSPSGALFLAGPPPLGTALLRVEDAVPGADGRPRVHWLPVPPHLATAREAVAWTFGKTARDYAPAVET